MDLRFLFFDNRSETLNYAIPGLPLSSGGKTWTASYETLPSSLLRPSTLKLMTLQHDGLVSGTDLAN